MDLLVGLPAILILAIVGTSLIGLSIVGLLLVRRFVPLPILTEHNDVAGFIFAVLGVVYAVVLAFVAVAVWESYESNRLAVDVEAAQNVKVHRAMVAFPEAERRPVHEALAVYMTSVVEDEWPAMRASEASLATESALWDLWASVQAVEPVGPSQEAWYDSVVAGLGDLTLSRDVRVAEASERLPDALTLLLLLGAVVTIAYTYLYGVRNLYGQLAMTVALAGIVALVISLIVALDAPFHGSTSIDPGAFERALELLAATVPV